MHQPMEGVRVLEVAQFTFVPAAGAVMADWGADVIKIAEGVPRKLIASPVQFDETPAELTRAPLFAEHTDELLRELGYDDEALIELKIAGAVT